MGRRFLICLILVAVTLVTYGQVIEFEFVDYDDNERIAANRVVHDGLTWQAVRWAWTYTDAYWQPLTMISLILDCQLYGYSNPAGHHLTNLIFHVLNVLLLFCLMVRMTGRDVPSAIVAALFSLHPLHVESVAWVSARTDVLSTAFGLMSLLAYVCYVRRMKFVWFAAAWLMMALGLLAKPLLVTLPLLMLLLDYWPLGRCQDLSHPVSGSFKWLGRYRGRCPVGIALLIEKIPFLVLSLVMGVTTIVVELHGEAMISTYRVTLVDRLANAIAGYAWYICKTVWPTGLSVLYPHPNLPGGVPWTSLQLLGAGVLLVGLTVLSLLYRRHSYLVIAWLWYLVALLPMIGLVQAGKQAVADRYAYVPQIGLFIMIVWAGADLIRQWSINRVVTSLVVFMVLMGCMVVSWQQIRTWENSQTLFRHAISIHPNNSVILNNLGNVVAGQDRDEALQLYRRALSVDPVSAKLHTSYGNALLGFGKVDEAIYHYREALHRDEKLQEAHYNLGTALSQRGEVQTAIRHLREAVRLGPNQALSHYNLGALLAATGDLSDAASFLKRAMQLDPDWVPPMTALAWLYAVYPAPELHNPIAAIELAVRAAEISSYQDAGVLDALAAAYASASDFKKAVATARDALRVATAAGNENLVRSITEKVGLYRQQKPHVPVDLTP